MTVEFEGGPCPRILEAETVTFSDVSSDEEQTEVGILTIYSQEPFTHEEFRGKFTVPCEYEML